MLCQGLTANLCECGTYATFMQSTRMSLEKKDNNIQTEEHLALAGIRGGCLLEAELKGLCTSSVMSEPH